ncbi:MAG: trimethylamine methyltransferase family protein [Candidatus Omnitrophica bacterium]|nr:trimethylamine methyltransferase family protein [Candidatus Omnitrophota bacterium]
MYNGHSGDYLKLLNEGALNKIHLSTINIMETTGIRFVTKEAISIFRSAGFLIENENIVKFRPDQVEGAIKKAPRKFTRHGLDPKYDIVMGDGTLSMGGGSLPLYVVDPFTYKRRNAALTDMVNFTRLVDGLKNLAIGNGVVKPWDVPDSVMHAIWNQNAVVNTYKPSCCWYATDKKTAQDTIDILSAACGGLNKLKEMKTWAITVCPDNSLTWGDSIIGLIEMAKVEVPIEILPMPFCGSMYPVTITGALVQANAETLSAIVLSQIINPGAPIIYAPSYGGIMDMSVGSHAFGTPETALYGAVAAQLGKWYGFPTNIMMGTTDSKVPDAQASYEKMMTMLLPALAGVDCMSLVGGMLDFALSASYEQMVIDNEIAGQVLRIRRGIEVNDETLAVDVIKDIGHGGHYLEHEHTLKHFREEFWMPEIADRYSREIWERNGGKDIKERAKEKVRQILAEHHPEPLDAEKRKEVDKVIKGIMDREGIGNVKLNF